VREGTWLVKPWQVVFTRQAQKDARRLASSGLRPKAEQLLALLAADPFQKPPPFEKLLGDLKGAYSRRINIQHRLIYQVLEEERIVKVLRMWTHYE
jgi:Txe/YoeB family toxin of toxin-antitoxin system